MKTTVSVALVVSLSVAACSKSEDAPTGGERSNGKVTEPAGGSTTTVTLPRTGLKVDVPASASVEEAIVGDGDMVRGSDLLFTVELATDSRARTLDAAKEEADMYSPRNLAGEALADGFWLTFDNTGGAGANFFVQVRREIGGKAYWCETTAATATQQANALAACKTLR